VTQGAVMRLKSHLLISTETHPAPSV